MEKEPILTVKDLSIAFHMYDKGLEQYDLKVISNLDLDVYPGEIVAIAGSSGSGKSLLAHAVMGLLPENALLSGTIAYKGKILDQADKEKLRGKKLALVPQSVAYLDPLMRIGTQVSGKGAPKKKVTLQKKIFQRLQLKENVEKLYPFQLSGGMARRVLVSTAVLSGADVIIADEPTPGLDLEMALENLAFHIADRVAVFYAGTTLEIADANDFLEGPEALRHPYSKALWKALPQNGFEPVPGFQPYAKYLPGGCLYFPRCPHRSDECEKKIPMKNVRGGRVRCIYAD